MPVHIVDKGKQITNTLPLFPNIIPETYHHLFLVTESPSLYICTGPAVVDVNLRKRHGVALAILGRLGGAIVPLIDSNIAIHELLEANTRMKDIQNETRHHDQHALEPYEQILARHQGAVPAAAQLGDPEDGPDKDADGREGQGAQEGFEQERAAYPAGGLALIKGPVGAVLALATPNVERKVSRAGHEDEENDDLKHEAGDHDVVARLVVDGVVVGGGDGAAGGLEDQGDDVAGYELIRDFS